MVKEKTSKMSVLGLGLGIGVWWAISMMVVGWTSIFGWGNQFMDTMASFYIGFEATFIGGVIGGIWGFFDGLIAGILIAFFYNVFKK